ncbi:MAG: RNA methyltransferase [Bacilli bacterium]|nr:RNA methyltransferase [Bacilli bacterium]
MLITSLDNDRIKGYIKLKDRKYRKKTNTFIVEGRHLVLEAYKAGKIIELILEKDEVLPLDLPVVYVTNEIISKISEMECPSTVMALCRMDNNEDVKGNKILLLDGIQDPGNLGTIIRSSLAFNVDTIVLSPDCVDLYNPKVIRSTQGMLFGLNIIRSELETVIEKLKQQEIPVYGTNVEYGEDVTYLKSKDKKRYGLIMGNEGQGVRREILDMCDKYLFIDMNEKVESLNVAVATSILLYELDKEGE